MGNARDAINEARLKMHQEYARRVFKEENEKISEEYRGEVKKAGVLTWFKDEDEFCGIAHEKGIEAAEKLDKIICFPPDVLTELKIYRKYVPELLKDYIRTIRDNNAHIKVMKRMRTDSEEKKYKKWTDAEDNELIELVCDSELSILDVSVTMGRTVPAIKSRLTKLVGIKRLSQEVAGRFIGTINGNHADCVVDGTIYKAE